MKKLFWVMLLNLVIVGSVVAEQYPVPSNATILSSDDVLKHKTTDTTVFGSEGSTGQCFVIDLKGGRLDLDDLFGIVELRGQNTLIIMNGELINNTEFLLSASSGSTVIFSNVVMTLSATYEIVGDVALMFYGQCFVNGNAVDEQNPSFINSSNASITIAANSIVRLSAVDYQHANQEGEFIFGDPQTAQLQIGTKATFAVGDSYTKEVEFTRNDLVILTQG